MKTAYNARFYALTHPELNEPTFVIEPNDAEAQAIAARLSKDCVQPYRVGPSFTIEEVEARGGNTEFIQGIKRAAKARRFGLAKLVAAWS